MKIGFTGSRHGMSNRQKEKFVELLKAMNPTEFHHGDCEGADAEAHDLVREHFPEVVIVVHPPELEDKRAYRQGDMTCIPLGYTLRDERIVDSTEFLFAAPLSDQEQRRSGTWYTIRYARRRDRNHYILPR